MKFLAYILLVVSASAAVVDPQAQGRRVVDRNIKQQVQVPRARDLAFEIRYTVERRKSNSTAKVTDARASKDLPTRFITVRKASNATAKAGGGTARGSNSTATTKAPKNNTARAVELRRVARLY